MISVFNRQEIKYVINRLEFHELVSKIEKFMSHDEHSNNGMWYSIYNLYIDTNLNELISHSLTKPIYKEKIRIRSYEPFSNDKEVFLEIKKRYKRITNKRRVKMKLIDAIHFIRNGVVDNSCNINDSQILKEFSHILSSGRYHPITYINYERLAYFDKQTGSDLRVTFDKNIQSKRPSQQKGSKVLDNKLIIMEIKSSKNIPMWLVNALNELDIHKQSFSKYGQEYIKFLINNQAQENI